MRPAGSRVGRAAHDRCGRRCREHLLGDGDRRSGRAPDDPTNRPRESHRADCCDRLLRNAMLGRSPGAARGRARLRNDDKLDLVRIPGSRGRCAGSDSHERTRWRRAMRRATRAWDGGTHDFHVARADRVRGSVCVLHHPDDARCVAEHAPRGRRAGGRTDRGSRLPGDCSHRRAPRVVRYAISRRRSPCRAAQSSRPSGGTTSTIG